MAVIHVVESNSTALVLSNVHSAIIIALALSLSPEKLDIFNNFIEVCFTCMRLIHFKCTIQ